MLQFYVHGLSFLRYVRQTLQGGSILRDYFRLTAGAGPYGWPRAASSLQKITACTITQRNCYQCHINRSHNEAVDSQISSDRAETSRQDDKISLNRKICSIFKVNNSQRMWVWLYPWNVAKNR